MVSLKMTRNNLSLCFYTLLLESYCFSGQLIYGGTSINYKDSNTVKLIKLHNEQSNNRTTTFIFFSHSGGNLDLKFELLAPLKILTIQFAFYAKLLKGYISEINDNSFDIRESDYDKINFSENFNLIGKEITNLKDPLP